MAKGGQLAVSCRIWTLCAPKAITRHEMAASAFEADQLGPRRGAGGEYYSFHQGETRSGGIAPGKLRCERQEELIQQTRRDEACQQLWSAFR